MAGSLSIHQTASIRISIPYTADTMDIMPNPIGVTWKATDTSLRFTDRCLH